MLASILPSEAGGLVGTWMTYERRTDSIGRTVREQSVRVEHQPTQRVFRSLSADSLSRVGYVVQDARGLSYYAPDPDVLLSPVFTDDHCFRLVATARDSSALLGIAFSPSRRERGRYDISGTAWIDRATAELRAIDFSYADLPGTTIDLPAGGRVEFVRLSSGEWFISSWYARLPVFAPPGRPGAPGTAGRRIGAVAPVLRAIHQTGGEVSRVARGDTVLFNRELPAVRVQVVSPDPEVRASQVTIRLQGTNLSAVSTADGAVHLGPLPLGEYLALVSHPTLDSIDAPPLAHRFRSRFGAAIDTLWLPTQATVVRHICPSVDSTAGSLLLRGTVRTPDGDAAAAASVTVRYLRIDPRSVRTTSIRWTEETRRATSDSRGRWRVCGVPRGTELAIEAQSSQRDALARLRLRTDPARLTMSAEVVLSPSTPVATTAGDTTHAALRFVVMSADTIPIPEATLDVADRGGDRVRTVVTDLLGVATMPDIAQGTVIISARRLGYQPGRLAFVYSEGTREVHLMLSAVAPPTLAEVRVSAPRVAGRFEAFETRRLNRAATASITRGDIEQRRPVHTWQMLTRVSSVRITSSALGVYAASGRGDRPSLIESGQACPMQIVVDGVRLSPPDGGEVDLMQLPPPESIHGIEVFAGAARIPLEFGGAGANKWCGVIAIWTR